MQLPISRDPVRVCIVEDAVDGLRSALAEIGRKIEAADSDELAARLEALADQFRLELERREAELDAVPLEARAAYLVRPPSKRERFAFERAVAAAGARPVGLPVVRGHLVAGVRQYAEGDVAELLAAVCQAVFAASDAGEVLADDLAAQFAEVEATVRAEYAPYRIASADAAHWERLAPYIAASMFLVGRVGAAPYKRRGGVIPDEILDAIPDDDRAAIGTRILRMVYLAEGDRKNSVSGSQSSTSPAPSTASDRSTAGRDGTSSASSTA